jgi:hypothetical protein
VHHFNKIAEVFNIRKIQLVLCEGKTQSFLKVQQGMEEPQGIQTEILDPGGIREGWSYLALREFNKAINNGFSCVITHVRHLLDFDKYRILAERAI